METNQPFLDGFTKEVALTSPEYDLLLQIKPGTDLDGTFRAWDCDMLEYIEVNGWLFTQVWGEPTDWIPTR